MNKKNIYYYIVKKVQHISAFLFYLFIIALFVYSLGFATNSVDLRVLTKFKPFTIDVQTYNRIIYHWALIMVLAFVFLLMIGLQKRGKHTFISFGITIAAGILGIFAGTKSFDVTNKVSSEYSKLDFSSIPGFIKYTSSSTAYDIGHYVSLGLTITAGLVILSALLITFTVFEEV